MQHCKTQLGFVFIVKAEEGVGWMLVVMSSNSCYKKKNNLV